jgi:integrase
MGAGDEDDENSPATFDADRRRVKNHILPVLGKYKIGQIGPREIERAKQTWKTAHNAIDPERTLSRKTVFHIFGLVRKMFNDAVLWKYIEVNPCAGVTPPKKGSATLEAIPIEAARVLMEHVSLAAVHVAALLMLLTGARRGEILALTRADFDFEEGTVWFRRSLTSLDGKTFTKEIKTGSKGRRKVPLLFLAGLLDAYLAQHPDLEGPILPSGGLRKNYGQYWHPRSFSSAPGRHFKALKISGASAHRLRHAFNSLGGVAGTNEAVRSKLMGHTKIQMTRDGYTTIYAEQAREAIRMLEASLKIGPK